MISKAYCFRSGEIEIGTVVDDGAIVLAKGSKVRLHDAVAGCARLAYDNRTWLVPGIPEARTDDEALEACLRFRQRLGRSLKLVFTP